MIQLEEKHRKIVNEIVKQFPYQFYVFGSRAKGSARQFSDLDVCIKDEINQHDLSKLDMLFNESDLPYKVDIVVYRDCDPAFQKILDKNNVLWEKQ